MNALAVGTAGAHSLAASLPLRACVFRRAQAEISDRQIVVLPVHLPDVALDGHVVVVPVRVQAGAVPLDLPVPREELVRSGLRRSDHLQHLADLGVDVPPEVPHEVVAARVPQAPAEVLLQSPVGVLGQALGVAVVGDDVRLEVADGAPAQQLPRQAVLAGVLPLHALRAPSGEVPQHRIPQEDGPRPALLLREAVHVEVEGRSCGLPPRPALRRVPAVEAVEEAVELRAGVLLDVAERKLLLGVDEDPAPAVLPEVVPLLGRLLHEGLPPAAAAAAGPPPLRQVQVVPPIVRGPAGRRRHLRLVRAEAGDGGLQHGDAGLRHAGVVLGVGQAMLLGLRGESPRGRRRGRGEEEEEREHDGEEREERFQGLRGFRSAGA
mmetsp:Transcript_132816/g.412956  ORF Transcript_132816/g.412956 Transcript_132816/m.412956 type:complete len:379 (+) Transcript_132816:1-1137(+)